MTLSLKQSLLAAAAFDQPTRRLIRKGNALVDADADEWPDARKEWTAAREEFLREEMRNQSLLSALIDVAEAARGIKEIGKRDTTNPKYDGYFESLDAALDKLEALLEGK